MNFFSNPSFRRGVGGGRRRSDVWIVSPYASGLQTGCS
jgi:hypothetical protein